MVLAVRDAVVLSSVQLTVEATVAATWVVAVTPTVTEVGAVIVFVMVQLGAVPESLQKPATFASAAGMVAASAPAASRPVMTA
jgi:hypothetical protein